MELLIIESIFDEILYYNFVLTEFVTDGSTQKILATHKETVQQYSHLTNDLNRMNSTVHQVVKIIEKLEDNISWITGLLGDTGKEIF